MALRGGMLWRTVLLYKLTRIAWIWDFKIGSVEVIKNGLKIPHVRSENYISEFVDQFNVAGIKTQDYGKIVVVMGRDEISVKEEEFVSQPDGTFGLRTSDEAVIMTRYIFANISMSIESARRLIDNLEGAIMQAGGTNAEK
ncbi:hypothetical protein [Pseudomonas lactucae]|uniref:hypothetical protein n=1 Tax=Pseudomonas lactucae TaxID=2813360 RepID=UPI002FCD0149